MPMDNMPAPRATVGAPPKPPTDMPPGAPPAEGEGNPLAAQLQAAVASLPEPDAPFTPKVMQALNSALHGAWGKVREAMPSLPELPPEEALLPKEYDGAGRMPESLAIPALLLSDLAVSTSGNKRYEVDPAELKDDRAIRKLSAQFDVMGRDKALLKALKEGGEPDGDEMPPKMEKPAMGEDMKKPSPIPKGVAAGL